MTTAQRFFISVDDLAKARGDSGDLSFHGSSPAAFAAELQEALRSKSLWEQWRAKQVDPDAVDTSIGRSDPNATVTAKQSDLHCDIEVVTNLSHVILRNRLQLLIGNNWQLRDVRAA